MLDILIKAPKCLIVQYKIQRVIIQSFILNSKEVILTSYALYNMLAVKY